MRENFQSMPPFLKLLTGHAMLCVLLLIIAVVPGTVPSIDGRAVSYFEWWQNGTGPCASVLGILGPLAAFAFVAKWCYARLVYLSFVTFGFVISPLVLEYGVIYALAGIPFVALAVACLYKWPSIRAYFTTP